MTLKSRPPDAFSPGKTPPFEVSARESLADSQLRRNLGKATQTIRGKRAVAVGEMPDWEELREAGRALKERTLRHLDHYLLQLEESVTKAGGVVHWARDADEANRIIAGIAKDKGAGEVVKVKSIATDETKLNEHLEREGIEAFETDLAELIIQLAGETSSHILVPAIHKNRAEIRELFLKELDVQELSDDPKDLTISIDEELQRAAVRALMKLAPRTALRLRDGREEEVRVAEEPGLPSLSELVSCRLTPPVCRLWRVRILRLAEGGFGLSDPDVLVPETVAAPGSAIGVGGRPLRV